MEEKKLPHDHGHNNEEKIREHLPGENEIAGVSEAMKQLGDPSRLRIFWLLCHCEECVLNIAAIVNIFLIVNLINDTCRLFRAKIAPRGEVGK